MSVAHTNALCKLPGTVFRQLETVCSVANEKSVEGTADIRRLNEPQIPSVFTVVLVPGSERWREILGHLLAADTSSTRGHGHGHGHVTAVEGGVTASMQYSRSRSRSRKRNKSRSPPAERHRFEAQAQAGGPAARAADQVGNECC